MNDSAPAVVRLVQGSLMAGPGAQKLFGSFGGPGLESTGASMEMEEESEGGGAPEEAREELAGP